MAEKILVVDDEKDLVDLMVYNLTREGFETLKAYDGEEALKIIKTDKPDLVILDLMLPGVQGLDVCSAIRKNHHTAALPVIMVTAKVEEVDKILGLEIGADDYVTKPFSVRELLARVRAVLRRSSVSSEMEGREIFNFKGLQIDFTSHVVMVNGEKVDLSPTEFKLLGFLSRRPGRVYTRDQILDHVWGDDTFVEPRTVDVHVKRLRGQIEENIAEPQYILTVRGVGYKFPDIQ
jgi:phosphate regulon transcriptional regulator PhoB